MNRNQQIINFFQKYVNENSQIKIITSKISLRAIEQLTPYFKKSKTTEIILLDLILVEKDMNKKYQINKDETELLNDYCENKIKNDLQDYAFSLKVKDVIESKIKIRTTNNINQSFILIKNGNSYNILIGASELTMGSLGFVDTEMLFVITEIKEQDERYFAYFDKIWKTKSIDIKPKIVKKLEAIYQNKSPYDLYVFTLSRIFQNRLIELDNDSVGKNIKFEDTQIYKSLYEFQKHAVHSIISKINNYNGCILADSVGLGKTYEALAVIKYFELQGKKVLVLSPKKISENWKQFNNPLVNNIFQDDNFHYTILNHTDLSRDKGYSGDINLAHMNWSDFDLVVVDESHNFKNGKFNNEKEEYDSIRYSNLMNKVILQGKKTAVLLLTATPVNNQMQDINSQINLITRDDDQAFINHNIKSISKVCRNAENKSKQWSELSEEQRTVKKYEQMIGLEFRKLIDFITIARSRRQIEANYKDLNFKFPKRNKPISKRPNIDIENKIDNIKDLNDKLRSIIFSKYKPLQYVKPEFKDIYQEKYVWKNKDNKNKRLSPFDRENSAISLMRINFLKRFESSIEAFRLTIKMILDSSKKTLDSLKSKSSVVKELSDENWDFDEEFEQESIFLESKNIQIDKKHLDIIKYESDLLSDINDLERILNEYQKITPSRDGKLKELINTIDFKIKHPINGNNKKIIIFTSFIDTAEYLYENIKDFFAQQNVFSLLVTGQKCKSNHPKLSQRYIEFSEALSYFSPKSKKLTHDLELTQGLDILIATDCISEGQNLQDCDYLINYDIHWNPIRLIQRFGRIDRIGSSNTHVQMVNFWPNIKLEEYIRLETRISEKTMKVNYASTSDSNVFISDDELSAEEKVRFSQLKQLEEDVVNLEDIKGDISFSSITLSEFLTDLKLELDKDYKKIVNQPNGIFSIANTRNNHYQKGVIFLFASNKSNNEKNELEPYYLVYVNGQTKEVVLTYDRPIEILNIYREIALNQKNVNFDLVEKFNANTNNGQQMEPYVDLLKLALKSINDLNRKNDTLSLFNGQKLIENDENDFNLISFLILDCKEEDINYEWN